MQWSRAGLGLALVVCVGCSEAPSSPTAARAALASCDAPSDCTGTLGSCFQWSCASNVCTPQAVACACAGNADCNDGNACTTDTCDTLITHTCTNTGGTVGGGCCNFATDCPAAANSCQTRSCVDSSCSYSAATPLAAGCCNVDSDCGAGGGFTCVNNQCGCSDGTLKYCSTSGICGHCCAAGDCDSTHSNGASCSVAGDCSYTSCKSGFGDCSMGNGDADGCETSTDTSTANCGGCGRACSSTNVSGATVCAGGLCTSACTGSFGNCSRPAAPTADDGCETNLATSTASCGSCGRACSGSGVLALACTSGKCTSSCNAGLGNCTQPTAPAADDGCETNLTSSPANCGACSRACSSSHVNGMPVCVGSLCTTMSCAAGFGNCSEPTAPTADDGCETATSSDTGNCGGCSIICAGPVNACQVTTCASSSCGYVSTGASGCCNSSAQCTPNVCQTASCTANRCVLTPKVGVAGCCSTVNDCPAQTNPCLGSTCVANQCGTMPVTCPDAGAPDLSVVDLLPEEDLSVPADAEADALPEDLARTGDLLDAAPPPPDISGYSLTGGGGCGFAGDARGSGLAIVFALFLGLLWRRRRA